MKEIITSRNTPSDNIISSDANNKQEIFVKRGHQVSGLDFTNDFLTTAKLNAKKMKLNIDFVRGNMKKTSTYFPKNNFDLVVSLYNSFGFFDRKSDDLKTLKEVHQVLKPGGIFIINTINGDGVLHRIQKPISNGHEISPDLFLIEKAEFNQKKMIVSNINRDLRILVSRDGEMSVNVSTNQIIFTDWASNINRIADLMKEIDKQVDPATAQLIEQTRHSKKSEKR